MITRNYFLAVNITLIDQLYVKITFMDLFLMTTTPRGEYSLEFLVGPCRPHLQIQTQFQTKKCYFPHPFSDLASKIDTRL